MIRQLIKKMMYPHSYNSYAYVFYLKGKGANIGENTSFTNPMNCYVDEQNAQFIEIGSKCCITGGVTILAHDWSVCVVAEAYHQMLPGQRRTVIGNNVFIGMNSTILMGAHIGDNVVIGAGSVVSGTVQSNSVYAGNPAHKIMDLTEYYDKCKKRYIPGAQEYARKKMEVLGRIPTIDEMGLYKTMFIDKHVVNEKEFGTSVYKEAYIGVPQLFYTVQELLDYSQLQQKLI